MELKIGNNRTVFYQWDSGQVLTVVGADTCGEVHFCSKAVPDALVCKIREENGMRLADVPNILLQAEMPITAYLFARREDGSETCCSRSFPVLRRPKPEGYVYTQTETLDYSNLDQRLRVLEENPAAPDASAKLAAQVNANTEAIRNTYTKEETEQKINDALGVIENGTY